MRNKALNKLLIGVLTAGALVTMSRTAHADHEADIAVGILGTITTTSMALPGLFLGIHNAAAPGPLGSGWKIAGYAFGGLNLTAGAAGLALAAAGRTTLGAALAISHLVVGALDIGLTVYGSGRSDRPGTRVRLAPLVGTDKSGQAFGGVSLQVVSF